MELFLSDYLILAKKWLGSGLLPEVMLDGLHHYSEQLPAIVTEACVEFNLIEELAGSDFSVGIPGLPGTKDQLAVSLSLIENETLRQILTSWVQKRSALGKLYSDLFLEFDVRTGARPNSIPRTIFAVGDPDSIAMLPAPKIQHQRVNFFLEKLPAEGYLKHIYTDGKQIARIVVYLPKYLSRKYLEDIGLIEFSQICDPVLSSMPSDILLGLHLDTSVPLQKVGYETHLQPAIEQGFDPDKFYRRLVTIGLCSNPSRQILADWTSLGGDGDLQITREVIVKLIASKSGVDEAKGYLGFFAGTRS